MVRFDTLNATTIEYGTNNFVEVARKVARDDAHPDDSGVEFLSITRGYRTGNGQRRFKMHFTLPMDTELLGQVLDAVASVAR